MPQPLRGFAMTILQRSYSSGLDHGIQKKLKSLTGCRGQATA
ncbi:hypothetical protein [Rickettsia endosymbiont of Ceutorhynchus obstrictus]